LLLSELAGVAVRKSGKARNDVRLFDAGQEPRRPIRSRRAARPAIPAIALETARLKLHGIAFCVQDQSMGSAVGEGDRAP
jgi:hypothetical protein